MPKTLKVILAKVRERVLLGITLKYLEPKSHTGRLRNDQVALHLNRGNARISRHKDLGQGNRAMRLKGQQGNDQLMITMASERHAVIWILDDYLDLPDFLVVDPSKVSMVGKPRSH